MSGSKALILGEDTRSFLAIVRSLGRRGVEVHAAPRRRATPALRSRYIAALHDLPVWTDGAEAWLAAMRALLQTERFDIVIPCDETGLLPLAHHRAALEPLTRLAIPDDRAIAVLFDKHETRELAMRLGIPVSPGRPPAAGDTAADLIAAFGLPLMVKPRRSFIPGALEQRRLVAKATDEASLTRLLGEADPEQTLIEGFVPGSGLGLSVLADKGRILQAFQHARVREDASGSYYRVSVPIDPAYRAAVAAMVGALDYTGVAMFEFRADAASGRWVLLEVNARPWGSLPLAVNAGVDIPWAWFHLLVAGEVLPPSAYRPGFYGRNLIPDLHAILRDAKVHPWRAVLRIAETARVLTGRERHDVLTWDDPKPGVIELTRLARSMLRRALGEIPGLAAMRGARARRLAASAMRRIAPQHPVVFVCQGNICRSPFAEEVARREGEGRIAVASAGLMYRPGRPTPAHGIAAAAARGIDLSGHRSSFLTADMAQAAGLIVIFDDINLAWLRDRYPHLQTPVVMLGQVTGIGELDDPVDGDAAAFERSYDRITAAVQALLALR